MSDVICTLFMLHKSKSVTYVSMSTIHNQQTDQFEAQQLYKLHIQYCIKCNSNYTLVFKE